MATTSARKRKILSNLTGSLDGLLLVPLLGINKTPPPGGLMREEFDVMEGLGVILKDGLTKIAQALETFGQGDRQKSVGLVLDGDYYIAFKDMLTEGEMIHSKTRDPEVLYFAVYPITDVTPKTDVICEAYTSEDGYHDHGVHASRTQYSQSQDDENEVDYSVLVHLFTEIAALPATGREIEIYQRTPIPDKDKERLTVPAKNWITGNTGSLNHGLPRVLAKDRIAILADYDPINPKLASCIPTKPDKEYVPRAQRPPEPWGGIHPSVTATCASIPPGFPPLTKDDVVVVKTDSALDELKELVYASAECHDDKSRKRILDIAFRQYEAKLES